MGNQQSNDQPCPGHVVKCGSCNGSGRDSLTPTIKACGVCKGVGSVLLK